MITVVLRCDSLQVLPKFKQMQTHEERVWTYAAVTVFTVIGISCSIMVIAQLPNWGDKKPEWIGALGTIAAFAGTIWIATSERRQRRDEALSVATLAAAHIYERINKTWKKMVRVRTNLRSDGDIALDDLRLARQRLVEAEALAWTREELLPLTCLSNHVAPRLQRVLTRRSRMWTWTNSYERTDNLASKADYLRMLRSDVNKNIADLSISLDELRKLLGAVYTSED